MTVLTVFTLMCFAIPIYVYAGYPLLLCLFTVIGRGKKHTQRDITPTVTLIISCFNESSVIEEKLRNTLGLDYPKDCLRILVVSDGSDDGTDDIVRGFEHLGIELIRQEGRLGKTMGLNKAMESVTSEITVFSDANAMYDEGAIKKLVRNFADNSVGYVVGAALYTDGNSGASARSENAYWDYELAVKRMESNLHSVVGGDGALYGIRTMLWQSLDQKDINDFVNPLQIVAKGYRGIFEPEARCYEKTAGEFDREIRRKERIVNRSIRGLFRVKEVVNPFRVGVFAWEVISHKLLRWLIPFFLIVGLMGSALLTSVGKPYFWIVTLSAIFLLSLSFIGHCSKDKNSLPLYLSLPYYFVMVNLYSMKGVIDAFLGRTQITWNSARSLTQNSGENFSAIWDFDAIQIFTTVSVCLLLTSLGFGYFN